MRRLLFVLAALGLLSLLLAAAAISILYPDRIYPQDNSPLVQRISRTDGWIEDGALISLPDLLPRGNRLLLHLKSWRPAGQPPARLRVLLCGEPVSEILVNHDLTHTVYLTGTCEPRQVLLNVLNPFSGPDQRRLGVQVKSLEITSRLGTPLPAPAAVLKAGLVLFAIAAAAALIILKR